MTMLDNLRERRAAIQADLEGGLAAIEFRGLADATAANLTPEEASAFSALEAEARELDGQISDIESVHNRRSEAAAAHKGQATITREPMTYDRHAEGNVSYFRDLGYLATAGHPNAPAAIARLNRHAAELEIALPERARRRADRAESELRSTFGETSSFEKRTNPNRTDGQGGYFVPPLWLIDEYIPLLRAGRTFVSSVRNMDLPEGTDSINIPKMASGTSTAVQTADAASVSSTDFTDTSVSAPVRTIAGQEDISIQLLEQSPGQIIDRVVMEDLIADYNRNCDKQSLNGTGSSGQVQGVYTLSGTNIITYTNGSPAATQMWTPLAQSLSKLAENRFDLTGVRVFMHPRRWFWIAGGLDTTNRPLVVPSGMGPFNPFGESEGTNAEGFVGNLTLGYPVFIDSNITTADTAGSGSGQDVVFTVKCDDVLWFEGELRTRVLPEILSGTLQVRFQVYNYVAQLTRYPEAVSMISGTGLAAPSGY